MPTPKRFLIAKQPQIGQCVRALRQELSLSQEKFAAQLGVSFHAVNRWESGKVTPSPMAIEKLQREIKKLGKRGQQILESLSNQEHQ